MSVTSAGCPADIAIQGYGVGSDAAPRRPDPRLTRLQRTANELVGSVFYGTLLRALRASNLKGSYGHGGHGEEVFQAQLDQVLAERAGRARGSSLSEAIVTRLSEQQLRVDDRAVSRPDTTGAAS